MSFCTLGGFDSRPSGNEIITYMERILIQFDSMEQVREFAREIYNSMRDDMQNDSRLLNAKEAAKAEEARQAALLAEQKAKAAAAKAEEEARIAAAKAEEIAKLRAAAGIVDPEPPKPLLVTTEPDNKVEIVKDEAAPMRPAATRPAGRPGAQVEKTETA